MHIYELWWTKYNTEHNADNLTPIAKLKLIDKEIVFANHSDRLITRIKMDFEAKTIIRNCRASINLFEFTLHESSARIQCKHHLHWRCSSMRYHYSGGIYFFGKVLLELVSFRCGWFRSLIWVEMSIRENHIICRLCTCKNYESDVTKWIAAKIIVRWKLHSRRACCCFLEWQSC